MCSLFVKDASILETTGPLSTCLVRHKTRLRSVNRTIEPLVKPITHVTALHTSSKIFLDSTNETCMQFQSHRGVRGPERPYPKLPGRCKIDCLTSKTVSHRGKLVSVYLYAVLLPPSPWEKITRGHCEVTAGFSSGAFGCAGICRGEWRLLTIEGIDWNKIRQTFRNAANI